MPPRRNNTTERLPWTPWIYYNIENHQSARQPDSEPARNEEKKKKKKSITTPHQPNHKEKEPFIE